MKLDKCETCEHNQVCGFKALKLGPEEKTILSILGCPVAEITPIVPLDSIAVEECTCYKEVNEKVF